MIGVVHGAEHAVAASLDDDRVKLLGLLTGYAPRTSARRRTSSAGPSTCSTSPVAVTGRRPWRWATSPRTPPGKATLRVYPGGAIGYQLFAIDPTLEEAIASWTAAGLGATTEVIA